MSTPDAQPSWPEHLRAIAEQTLRETPVFESGTGEEKLRYLESFCDEFKRKHPADRPLLARVLDLDPAPVPERLEPVESLLWAMHDRSIDPQSIILPSESCCPTPLLYDPADDTIAIEWRTVDELTALHALWNIASDRDLGALKLRCFDAAQWHVANLQPDNATNHPWAIHVFYELSQLGTDHRSMGAPRFHAETLLHNCRVQLGRPDLVSAWILMDAANTLEITERSSRRRSSDA